MNKKTINTATVNTEDPTPGYMFKEIIDMTFLDISAVTELVDFLVAKISDAIANEQSYTIIKTMKLIQQMCQIGHVEFQVAMQHRVEVLKGATMYTGGYSVTNGNAVRQQVKAAARAAIDATFVVRKNPPIRQQMGTGASPQVRRVEGETKEQVHADINKMYARQHRKQGYVAPMVPMPVEEPSVEVEELQLVEPTVEVTVAKPETPEHIILLRELIKQQHELENGALGRFYDKCTRLAVEAEAETLWTEICEELNLTLGKLRGFETKRNALRIIEFLLKKGVRDVSDYFHASRSKLKEVQRKGAGAMVQRVSKIFSLLPEAPAEEEEEVKALPAGDFQLKEALVSKSSHATQDSRPVTRAATTTQPRATPTAPKQQQAAQSKVKPLDIDDIFRTMRVAPAGEESQKDTVSGRADPTKQDSFSELHDLIFS